MVHVKCPRCSTVVEKVGDATPVCPTCGYGAPSQAAPVQAVSSPNDPWSGMSAPAQPQTTGSKPPTSGLAITALVLGLVGICVSFIPVIGLIGIPVALAAIITGGIGLSQIGKNPGLGGKGMAVAGLILGIISLLLAILITVGLFQFAKWFDEFCEENPDEPECQEDDGNATRGMNAAGLREPVSVGPSVDSLLVRNMALDALRLG